jgi:hypothetical protein
MSAWITIGLKRLAASAKSESFLCHQNHCSILVDEDTKRGDTPAVYRKILCVDLCVKNFPKSAKTCHYVENLLK